MLLWYRFNVFNMKHAQFHRIKWLILYHEKKNAEAESTLEMGGLFYPSNVLINSGFQKLDGWINTVSQNAISWGEIHFYLMRSDFINIDQTWNYAINKIKCKISKLRNK